MQTWPNVNGESRFTSYWCCDSASWLSFSKLVGLWWGIGSGMWRQSFSDCNVDPPVEILLQCGASQRRCLSQELPGDADAVAPWTTLKKQDVNVFAQCLEHSSACWITVPVCGSIPEPLNGRRLIQDLKVYGLLAKVCLEFLPTPPIRTHLPNMNESQLLITVKLKKINLLYFSPLRN